MELPKTWTLIAESQYTGVHGTGYSRWASVPGAIMTPGEARKMHDDGHILMAQKRLLDGIMGLMIKARGK
jgi:hypothetical protein